MAPSSLTQRIAVLPREVTGESKKVSLSIHFTSVLEDFLRHHGNIPYYIQSDDCLVKGFRINGRFPPCLTTSLFIAKPQRPWEKLFNYNTLY